MIISLTLNGEIYSVEPEQIYQGANNVNEIFIFAPLSANTSFEMTFTLPNGHTTKPYVLERVAPVSSQLNTWKLVVDAPLTQHYGVVKYQFKGTINGVTTATGQGSFTITQGVDWTLPETPDTNTYELILNKIAQIEGEVINANANSESALLNSQEALDISRDARVTSEKALASVQDAITKGNQAIEIAQGVDSKAETALANSQQANENALEAIERAEEAKAIASEKSNSKVFDTYSEMVAWLRNADNKGKLAVGSTLYIKDENVPDYWVTEVYEETDTLGFYYGFEELESKLPDISNMVTTDTEQNITGAKNFTSIKKNGYDLQGKLTGIDFVSTDNMTTYADGKATIYGEFTTTTETDQTANVISGSIEFGIKGSDTIVVEEDEEGNAIEIHLDQSVEQRFENIENKVDSKADNTSLNGLQQQIDQTNIDINEVRNIANGNTETLKVKANAIDLSNLDARALKTPLSAPSEVKLVAINTNNAQTLIDVPSLILYDEPGSSTTGAMTQKATTNYVDTKHNTAMAHTNGAFEQIANLDAELTALEETVASLAGSTELSDRVGVLEENYNLLDTAFNEKTVEYDTRIYAIEEDYVKYSEAENLPFVHKTGSIAETVSGDKTFTGLIKSSQGKGVVTSNGNNIISHSNSANIQVGNTGMPTQINSSNRPKVYRDATNYEQMAYISDIPDTSNFATKDEAFKIITDTSVRIWDLASGTYILPNNCKIYYNGSTNTANYYNAQGDRTILEVNTSKAGTEKFFKFEYTTGSNAYYQYYIFTGMTTASNGYVKGFDFNGDTFAKTDLSNVTYPSNTKGSTTTGSADRIIETYISSDGNTWVRKYASGWKEFGMQFTIGTSGWHTITFPVSFTAYNTYNLNCMTGQTSENTTNFIPNIAGRTVNTVRFVMRYERSNSAGTAAQDCYIYITGRGW